MNKKLFTGLMAFVLLSGIATAQDTYYEDFEDNESEQIFKTGQLLDLETYYDSYTNNQGQKFLYFDSAMSNYKDISFEAYNTTKINFMYGLFQDNAESHGKIALVDSQGSEVFYIRHSPALKNDLISSEYKNLYISNSNTEVVMTPQEKAYTSNSDLKDGQFLNTTIKFLDNGSMNITISALKEDYDTVPEYLNYSTDDIKAVRVYGKQGDEFYKSNMDELSVNASQFGIRDYPDFSLSIPLPRVVDSLGIPFGGLLVLNFFIGVLSLLVALIPAPVFRGWEAFTTYVGGIITTAETTLSLGVEYMGWIQTVGVQRLKEILGVIGIIALVRYGSVLKEGATGDRSMIGAVEWIASDLIGKAESIERIIYRASDTLTNITHLGFYLIESVINVYKTIKNHLPLIG